MSKPQVASEPSMEEILTSIRKMISDDKPGPSPLPDVMGRTPFGESLARSNAAAGEGTGQTGDASGRSRPQGGSNFNSLSDALKVATSLSDQRRALQQEIAEVLEKGPRSNLDALTELSAARSDAARSFADEQSKKAGSGSTVQPGANARATADQSTPSAGTKPDLLGFDFGTVVPERESGQAKPKPGDEKQISPAIGAVLGALEAATAKAKADTKPEAVADTRVLPLRSGLNGSAAHGLNGSASVNVAPFPRPAREPGKPGDTEAGAETAPAVAEEPAAAKPKEASAEPVVATLEPASMAGLFKGGTLDKHGEALLDAVVDLVQQKPGALSVFASGDSFIHGSSGKKPAETLPAITQVSEVVDASGAPAAGGPKIDRAAAELLRPMLRQWLAENMERILEDALRSELSDKVPDKEPEKS